MGTVLVVLHVIVCVFLIAVVLLQRGKGAEIGAVFGGGASSTVFGSRGAGNLLTKLTTLCAALFMITSLGLAYVYTSEQGERLFDQGVAEEQAPPSLLEEVAPAAQPEPAEPLSAAPEPGGAGAGGDPPAAEEPAQQP
jgi:preprotein translocase subunit SecG